MNDDEVRRIKAAVLDEGVLHYRGRPSGRFIPGLFAEPRGREGGGT